MVARAHIIDLSRLQLIRQMRIGNKRTVHDNVVYLSVGNSVVHHVRSQTRIKTANSTHGNRHRLLHEGGYIDKCAHTTMGTIHKPMIVTAEINLSAQPGIARRADKHKVG